MSNGCQKGNAERQIISAYELSTGRKSGKCINTEIIKNMNITGTVRTHEGKVFPLVIFLFSSFSYESSSPGENLTLTSLYDRW